MFFPLDSRPSGEVSGLGVESLENRDDGEARDLVLDLQTQVPPEPLQP
jgi:hypothetical protein